MYTPEVGAMEEEGRRREEGALVAVLVAMKGPRGLLASALIEMSGTILHRSASCDATELLADPVKNRADWLIDWLRKVVRSCSRCCERGA